MPIKKFSPIKIKHKGKIGYRISDIGVGGKEYNVRDFGYEKDKTKRYFEKEAKKLGYMESDIGVRGVKTLLGFKNRRVVMRYK